MTKRFWLGTGVAALVLPALALAGSTAKPRVPLMLKVTGPGTVAASPGGRCNGYLARAHTCRFVYADGTRVRIRALPKTGARLSSWSGSLSGRATTKTLTMNRPRVVTARFVKVAPPPPPPVDPLAAGKQVFMTAGCGGCHTLADAGTTGTVGPNLDAARPSKELVVDRVTNGRAPMPSFAGQLTAQQIDDVATYVSSVAGR